MCTHVLSNFAQEAQRAAKATAANKQGAGQKQKETTAVNEETKKLPLTKTQTSSSNVTKSDHVSVAGKFIFYTLFYQTWQHSIIEIIEVADIILHCL